MKVQSSEEQFLGWYDEYADAIFRHCSFRLSDREKAQDVTQETFIRAWGYVAEGKGIVNIRAFLYKIANNLIIDEYRRKQVFSLDQMQEESGFDVGFDMLPQIEQRDEVHRVENAIEAIPEQYREAFIMRHIDGLSVREIAQITGDTENLISVRIHRAIEKIKNIYGERA